MLAPAGELALDQATLIHCTAAPSRSTPISIVQAADEYTPLGLVMGPSTRGMLIAVSNPLFVDGDDFRPNGDLLDAPLPGARPAATIARGYDTWA
ncbi:MAG: hypothetical protein U0836_18185 [Pirellulales bacterium]